MEEWKNNFSIAPPVYVIPSDRVKDTMNKVKQYSDCGGFVRTYKAACAFLKVTPNPDLIWDIENIAVLDKKKSWGSERQIVHFDKRSSKAIFLAFKHTVNKFRHVHYLVLMFYFIFLDSGLVPRIKLPF